MPDDLILSIKQAEIPKEFLGPPSKKTLQNPKPAVPVSLDKTSDVTITKINNYLKYSLQVLEALIEV